MWQLRCLTIPPGCRPLLDRPHRLQTPLKLTEKKLHLTTQTQPTNLGYWHHPARLPPIAGSHPPPSNSSKANREEASSHDPNPTNQLEILALTHLHYRHPRRPLTSSTPHLSSDHPYPMWTALLFLRVQGRGSRLKSFRVGRAS
jgi:hypothetical protein